MASIIKESSQEKKQTENKKSKLKKSTRPGNVLEQQNDSSLRSGMAFENPGLSRPEDILSLQKQYGNQAVSGLIQAKLRVGPVGDHYEQEADRMADRVMSSASPAVPEIQAKKKLLKPVQDSDEEESLMMKPQQGGKGGFDTEAELEKRINSKIGGGIKLPGEVRSFMEQRFQQNFSDVRVHADSEAASLNQDLNARAFTRGRDLFFNSGEYQPGTNAGDRLIAHELTHVVQQSGGSPAVIQRKEIWEEVGMTEAAWNALTDVQKRAKLKTAQRTDALSEKSLLEKGAEWTGGNIANSAFGVANLGLGIESTREGDNSLTPTSAVSIGVTGLQMLGSGVSFAGAANTMYRSRTMFNRGSRAGRLVGRRMVRQSAWSMSQQLAAAD
jgi:hypothetical protein